MVTEIINSFFVGSETIHQMFQLSYDPCHPCTKAKINN